MTNKGPKTEKGKARELVGGKGNEKIGTTIGKTLNDPVVTVDKELGRKKKNKTW